MAEKRKLPKMFTILKIVGAVLAVVGIALIITGVTRHVPSMGNDGWFEAESAKSGLIFGGVTCLMFGASFIFAGLTPNISKSMSQAQIQTTSEIMTENKDDLKHIADTKADVASGAITKTARAIKDGFSDTKYCKECGKKIASDSKFCKYCGSGQE